MNLEKIGVPGIDEVLNGGVIEKSNILIKGSPGVGKTILAMQFLLAGAKKGDAGIFICVEEKLDFIRNNIKLLGLDLDAFEKKKLIYMFKQNVDLKKPLSIADPMELIRKGKVKRVVLDSLTLFKYISKDEVAYRKELLDLLNNMKDVTFLAVAEDDKDGVDNVNFTAEDFLFDCVLKMVKIRKGNTFEKCLYVSKSRGQDHLESIFPYVIKDGGITVYPREIPFSLLEKDFREKK